MVGLNVKVLDSPGARAAPLAELPALHARAPTSLSTSRRYSAIGACQSAHFCSAACEHNLRLHCSRVRMKLDALAAIQWTK